MEDGDMRVQLLSNHVFRTTSGSSITLVAGSFIGANPGDYPISQLAGGTLQVTTAMIGLDGAATTAISAEVTRQSAGVIPPGQGPPSGAPAAKPHKGQTLNSGYGNM
jgi:hypothetical protein